VSVWLKGVDTAWATFAQCLERAQVGYHCTYPAAAPGHASGRGAAGAPCDGGQRGLLGRTGADSFELSLGPWGATAQFTFYVTCQRRVEPRQF
jgi:hypothetical protein